MGCRVWRDMECMICGTDSDWRAPVSLIVLETGRLMTHGPKEEVAEYMNKYEYRPTEEK